MRRKVVVRNGIGSHLQPWATEGSSSLPIIGFPELEKESI